MTDERFVEFATQSTDNGEINNGFYDIKTGEWYYTKDSENAKKICELLNELHEENEQLRHDATILIQSNQDYRKENEELKEQLTDCEKFRHTVFQQINQEMMKQ